MTNKIDPIRKHMILSIADGDFRCLPYLHQLDHSPKRLTIYKWFISNRITGAKFYSFFEERNFSVLRVIKHVLFKVEGEKRDMIAGRDL